MHNQVWYIERLLINVSHSLGRAEEIFVFVTPDGLYQYLSCDAIWNDKFQATFDKMMNQYLADLDGVVICRQTSNISHLNKRWNCWSLRCSWSIACRCCSNYIFILDLTLFFNGLDKDNCETRWERFIFLDLVRLVLDVLRYVDGIVVYNDTWEEYITRSCAAFDMLEKPSWHWICPRRNSVKRRWYIKVILLVIWKFPIK